MKQLLVALALMLSESLFAEEIAVMDTSKVHDLDEIVIVSQPKENARLRLQPVSSTVFSDVESGRLHVNDLREISAYVPSFHIANYGSRITPSVYVRGIGSRINSPAIAIYMDNMPMVSKSGFAFYTYDLERVDFLRGPQGTLYGMNTEGGLVRLYTRNPFTYQGTDVTIGGGSRGYRKLEFSHYNKVSSRFAFSVGGFYTGQNGFFRNEYDGGHADKIDEGGLRLKLGIKPTASLTANVVFDYQHVGQNGNPYGPYYEDPSDGYKGKIGTISQDRQSKYWRNMLNTGLNIVYNGRGFDLTSNTSYQWLKDDARMDQDYSAAEFVYMTQRQRQSAVTQEFAFKSNNSSRWHWTTGLFGMYQWLNTESPVFFGQDFGLTMMRTATIANSIRTGIYNSMYSAFTGAGMPDAMASQRANGIIDGAGGVGVTAALTVPGYFETPQANIGVFHQSDIDITDHFTVTLGLRYDYNHTKILYNTFGDMAMAFSIMGVDANVYMPSYYSGSDKANFNQLLPKAGLTYKFHNGSNVYATVSKGYRAGGFNMQMFAEFIQTELGLVGRNIVPALQPLIDQIQQTHQGADVVLPFDHSSPTFFNEINEAIKFKPEVSWNYEVGTHLNLFDSKLHADLSVYYMQIRDQQLSVMTPGFGFGRMMVNAGKSYSCGAELSLRGSLFSNRLAWSAGYGFTRAKFKEYTTGTNDYSGNYVPFVPQHTFNAMADYTLPVGRCHLRSVTIGANVYGLGNIRWDEANQYRQKLYAVLGAHADADFGVAKISVWGRNLTNTVYNTFVFNGMTGMMGQQGNPFQMGVDVKLHF